MISVNHVVINRGVYNVISIVLMSVIFANQDIIIAISDVYKEQIQSQNFK